MKFFRFVGLLLLVLGTVFSVIAIFTLAEFGSTLKIFIIGPGFLGLGIGMIAAPGKTTFAQTQSGEVDADEALRVVGIKNKIIWGICAVVGTFGGFVALGV